VLELLGAEVSCFTLMADFNGWRSTARVSDLLKNMCGESGSIGKRGVAVVRTSLILATCSSSSLGRELYVLYVFLELFNSLETSLFVILSNALSLKVVLGSRISFACGRREVSTTRSSRSLRLRTP